MEAGERDPEMDASSGGTPGVAAATAVPLSNRVSAFEIAQEASAVSTLGAVWAAWLRMTACVSRAPLPPLSPPPA